MEHFDPLFREEAIEQLEIAEQALLAYEDSASSDLIEEAFRALHTFKGAAHIFSLKNLGDFAHLIESILDGIRKEITQPTQVLLSQMLGYLDHLKRLMDDPELTVDEFREEHNLLVENISVLVQQIHDAEKGNEKAMLEYTGEDGSEAICSYYLLLTPIIAIEEGEKHPVLNIIEDLKEIGTGKIVAHTKEEDGKTLYKQWDIYTASDQTLEDIEALFLFVDDEVTIEGHKIANFNLFNEEGFEDHLSGFGELSSADKIEALTSFVTSLSSGEEEKLNIQTNQNYESKTGPKSATSIRVSTEKIDILMNLVSELVTAQASLGLFASQHKSEQLDDLVEGMDRHIRQLRDIAFEVTLVPIESMMGRFKRLVRDTSADIGKDVEFIIAGENTELDKTFIDKLTDPIMHILRNSIDHGIGTPKERERVGKSPKGTVKFDAYYSGANVHIEITDDGKGLDADAILNKAREKGLLKNGTPQSKKEIFELIFLPGFSTAKSVTDVSGRGVGMDVVRKNIQEVRGEIDIESELGKGTKFTIKVPLTLSIIDGLLFRVDNTRFVVPLQMVHKCYEIPYTSMSDSFNQLLVLDDQQVPFVNIREQLLETEGESPEFCNAITLNLRDKVVAILADEIEGEYQAVLKPVGNHYKHQDFLSGASILGDGTVALVLDANKLIDHKKKQIQL